ncbi:hypothetical protein PG987_011841 [Apiospora arundinis]
MPPAARQDQEEATLLALSRARMPRLILEYKRPRPQAGAEAGSATKRRKTKKGKGKAAKQRAMDQKCMLLQLPTELRFKIYEEACFQGTHITVDSDALKNWDGPFKFSRPKEARAFVNLLRVCKSIYHELRGDPLLFFQHKYFEFDEPQVLHNFARAIPGWSREWITHVDLEPRRLMGVLPTPYSKTPWAFQVLMGADDVPATAPDPGSILSTLPEMLPGLKQLRIISSWEASLGVGVEPMGKDMIRALTAIPNLRHRIPGKHHRNPAMRPKEKDFSFGFLVAVRFVPWLNPQPNAYHPKTKEEERQMGYHKFHKYCVHCFISEFRGTNGQVKKYGGKLRNLLKGVDWCVSTDELRPFRQEEDDGDD